MFHKIENFIVSMFTKLRLECNTFWQNLIKREEKKFCLKVKIQPFFINLKKNFGDVIFLFFSYKDQEFTITSGIINVKSESKDKQVCLSVISTKLPTSVQIKAHDLNSKFTTITIVKYSLTLLNTKTEILKTTVADIEKQALAVNSLHFLKSNFKELFSNRNSNQQSILVLIN